MRPWLSDLNSKRLFWDVMHLFYLASQKWKKKRKTLKIKPISPTLKELGIR